MRRSKLHISIIGAFIASIVLSCLNYVQVAEAYTVNRLSGKDRYGTAVSISRTGWQSTDCVVLATGEGDDKFADALAGAPLAHALNAPILLTGTETINEDTRAEIKRLKAKNVYILGGIGVIAEKAAGQLKEIGLTVSRLWGYDRYETAVQIAEELKKQKEFDKVFITTGEEFQYAMMIAPFAAKNGIPILFTGKAALNTATEEALKKWGIKNAEIIGNADVISKAVEDRLKSVGLSVKRIEGHDVSSTNIEIIKSYGNGAESLAIARDDIFVDALAGTPYAAAKDMIVILTGQESISSRLLTFIKELKISKMHVFGGPGAVSEDVVSIINGDVQAPGEPGNTAGNINNLGLAAFADGWIYYSNIADDGKIYKMKPDGSGNTKLCEDGEAVNINVVNGWVYYSSGRDGYKLYKVRVDGSSRTKVSDDIAYCVNVSGDWIYYIKSDGIGEGGPIIKIKTDGTGRTQVDGESSWNINIDGLWIYYANLNDGYKLYRIKVDGTGKTKLGDDSSWFIQKEDVWVYYSDANIEEEGNAHLIKMKKDGSSKSELNKDETYCINVSGDFIYYVNSSDGNKLYKIKRDGTDSTKLNDSPSWYINIAGGWIYYMNYESGEKLYRMDLEGKVNQQVDTRRDRPLSGRGNTGGNIVNGGTAASDGKYIYYINDGDGYKIYRKKLDGSEKTKMNNDNSREINVVEEWIFYTNISDGSKLYKIMTDGTNRTRVNNDTSWYASVADNWIYYSNLDDGGKAYKVKTDGSGKIRLNNDSSGCINIYDDWVYYVNLTDSGKLYKMKTDGSAKAKLNDEITWAVNVSDGWIYYSNESDKSSIYRMKIDGSSIVKLVDNTTYDLNVSGDYIYYSNASSGDRLYKVKTDGTNNSRLCEDSAYGINVVGDCIYYSTYPEGLILHSIKIDGSNRKKVE